MKIKGQNFRAFAAIGPSDTYAALTEATSCSVSLTGNTESSSTKDTVGDYQQDTVVTKSWQVSVETLDAAVTDLKGVVTTFQAKLPVQVGWDQTAGTSNRAGQNATFKRSGNALLNDVSISFNDRANIAVSLQFQGQGALS